MIRVLVAEDSVTARELLVHVLEADPEIRVIGQAATGLEAVRLAEELGPDLVTMDIQMPGCDGLEATRRIMEESPCPIVVVSGHSDVRQVHFSMQVLEAGALAVQPKIAGPQDPDFAQLAGELVEVVKTMAGVPVIPRRRRDQVPLSRSERAAARGGRSRVRRGSSTRSDRPPPEVVAVGVSTGGPGALNELLSRLPGDYATPILVVQHISEGFVEGMASWLDQVCPLGVDLARSGELLEAGRVYLAPDGGHLEVDEERRIHLSSASPEGGFRPSANPLFRSVARVFGERAVGLILTGIGRDGVDGLRLLKERGGRVVAQDRESAVVWGMPGAAVEEELVDRVLPLQDISDWLAQLERSGESSPPPPVAHAKGLRVLLVEDSRTQALKLQSVLEENGYQVELARDGEAGLERARSGEHDLVLSDIVMPRRDGLGLTRELKASEVGARLPVVLLTSDAEPRTMIQGLAAGADNFVAKSCEPEEILRRLRSVLARHRDRRRERIGSGRPRAKERRAPLEVHFLDERFRVGADRAQILDYLLSVFEDYSRVQQQELATRRQAEAAQESQRFMQGILDSLTSLICVLDGEGHILAVNHTWRREAQERGLGHPEHGVGLDYLDVCRRAHERGDEIAGAVHERLRRLLAGDARSFDLEYPCEERWFLLHGRRVDGEEGASIVLDHEEITQTKRTIDDLQQREAQLDLVLAQQPAVLWSTDRELRFTLSTGSALGSLGLERNEVVGRSLSEFLGTEDPENPALAASRRALEGEHGTYQLDFGGVTWDCSVRPFRDGSGAIVGTLGMAFDVSARRDLERQLAVADRMASVGVLAAGVAHEINNPLTYVLHNLEGLRESLGRFSAVTMRLRLGLAEELGQETAEVMLRELGLDAAVEDLTDSVARADEALNGADRVRGIVRELKTFSHTVEEPVHPVDLGAVLRGACNMARNAIRFRARFVEEIEDCPHVVGVDGPLSQVFLNLLVNAAQATPEGNVEGNTIRIRCHAPEGDRIRVSVMDTGDGIAPENLERLFDPFFTTKPAGEGSGLGLSICRNIVTGYGGQMEVESEVGVGTTFSVLLPLAEAPERAAEAEAENETAAEDETTAVGRILVVDDEKPIAAMLERILKARCEEVVVVHSGASARELLQKDGRFDAVLTDLMMAEESGMDLYRWIEENRPELQERVAFMTGGAFTEKTTRFLQEVSAPVVDKPFRPREVREVVRRLTRGGGDV